MKSQMGYVYEDIIGSGLFDFKDTTVMAKRHPVRGK